MGGLILLSILLAPQIADRPNAAIQVEASVAFGGHIGSSKFTELRVRAVSPDGGTINLETVGSSPEVSFSLELARGEPAEISVPLGIDFSKPPAVLQVRRNQANPQNISLNYIQHSTPRSVLVGSLATRLLLKAPGTESVSGETMPRLPPAYGQLTALAIDGRTLAALDDAQLRSLLEYVGVCGRVMLIDVSGLVEQVFVNRAACDGRFLKIVDSTGDVEATFLELIGQQVPALPSDEQLGRLLEESFRVAFDLTTLGLFWVGYLIVFVGLISRSRTRLAAFGFSIVGTMLVLVIWPSNTTSAYVAWAETSSIGRVARFAGLERHSASRLGTYTLPGDSHGIHPEKITSDTYSLRWNADNDQRNLVWHASPFQQIDKLTRGSFAVDPMLRASITDNNASVCNLGAVVSPITFLHWQGSIFAIPPMSPGTTWSSVNQMALDAVAMNAPELQLLLDRSLAERMSLLQLLPMSVDEKNERAWLLQYESEQLGDSPCGI